MISRFKCMICENCKASINIEEKDYAEVCMDKRGWGNSQLLNGIVPCCMAPRIFFCKDSTPCADGDPTHRWTVELEGIPEVHIDRTEFIVDGPGQE